MRIDDANRSAMDQALAEQDAIDLRVRRSSLGSTGGSQTGVKDVSGLAPFSRMCLSPHGPQGPRARCNARVQCAYPFRPWPWRTCTYVRLVQAKHTFASSEKCMSNAETYLERAADCRQEAEETNLPNVREKCLRAAIAWEGMADRVLQADERRADEEHRKLTAHWRSAPRPHRA